jgi:hypothetical protein
MAKKIKRTTRRAAAKTECTIPPAIPDSALPNLMFKRDRRAEKSIRDYVEWQAPDEKVTHAERVTTEIVMGRRLEGWDVRTNKGRWWVITEPTNLYSQKLFPSPDYTISFQLTANFIPKSSLLGALVLATAAIGQAAQAAPTPVEATAALQAASISKQRAEAIALQAVGGGTVLQAVLEREDHFIHWSVDIVDSTDEHEVWVSTHGKVLKIITQPL